ncbi:stressosome-associated protein Prli42 [Fervidibacillus albus]|uniref:Stressosome-associated protein Prli42 n=1 Tax=Fervidibacillus albus TaxID=2980026 RepID=A0A9E8LVI9_9BACI|nr:stressosome-associated protein Prli42 [Fervidibacillus albus]WAA10478.1 stressosome-associated protein Prli42 [Fervidibacillus albus]
MKNKRVRKFVVYLMLIAILASTFMAGLSFLF